jgi:hypothetical protein
MFVGAALLLTGAQTAPLVKLVIDGPPVLVSGRTIRDIAGSRPPVSEIPNGYTGVLKDNIPNGYSPDVGKRCAIPTAPHQRSEIVLPKLARAGKYTVFVALKR